MKNSNISLTGKELVDVLTSNEFCMRIAQAARITDGTGYESGFKYYYDFEAGKRYLTSVVTGDTDGLNDELYEEWRWRTISNYPAGTFQPLLCFHNHPIYREPLGLSYCDLEGVVPFDGEDYVNPVIGVGTVDPTCPTWRCDVLFMRLTCDVGPNAWASSQSILEQAWINYLEVAELDWPNKEAARSLEVPGFLQAEVVRFDVPPREAAKIVNINDLEKFAAE